MRAVQGLPYPFPLLRGVLAVTRPPSPEPYSLAVIIVYYMDDNISSGRIDNIDDNILLIMYIDSNRQTAYNIAILEKVPEFIPARERGNYGNDKSPATGS